MIPKNPYTNSNTNTSWVVWLLQMTVLTTAVTIVSVASAWGGYKLFSFFRPPSAPAQKPPGTYATVDSPDDEPETTDESESESASDEDSASVVGEAEVRTLTFGESSLSVSFVDISHLPQFAHLYAAGSEVGSQDTTVAICDVTPSYVAGSGCENQSSVSLLSEPTVVGSQSTTVAISDCASSSGAGSENPGESQETNAPTMSEDGEVLGQWWEDYQREKKTRRIRTLRDSIEKKESDITTIRSRIQDLVNKCDLMVVHGVPKEVVRSSALYKEVTTKLSIQEKLVARCATLMNELNELTEAQIEESEPSHVATENRNEPRPLDEESLPREEIAIGPVTRPSHVATENRNEPRPLDEESLPREEIAIGPVTRYISTSCSSTRAILPIESPKEKSPSPKEKSPSPSDSETPRIEWGRRS